MYDLNEAVNKLIQYYRHDFLNILQMVSGLAQLQKTDRLMTYIRKVTDEVQQFGRFIGCGDARFALLLYEGLLHDLDGKYVIRVDGILPLLAQDTLLAVERVLATLNTGLANLPDFTLHVYIQGGQAPALHLLLSPETQADDLWQPVLAAAKENGLTARLQAPGKFSLPLDKCGAGGEK
ncbi:MAG: hypothetical protein GX357_04415 [Firmicutes bacterium]|nr:hypothetical protein [Bacillota bacterium]